MALTVIEAAPIFDAETQALADRLELAKAVGDVVLPHLVGVTTFADYRPIDAYKRGLHTRAKLIDPDHVQDSEDGHQLFRTIDCANEYEAAEVVKELAYQPGVGVLLFRPFKDDASARRLNLVELVPDAQNVDGQVRNGIKTPKTLHVPGTVQSVLRILEHARREQGGLGGIKTAAVIGAGPAVGLRTRAELEQFCDVVGITLDENQKWINRLGAFDVVVAAAGGGPNAAEIIKPDDLGRGRALWSRRPPVLVVDAAYEYPEPGKPAQGNLNRIFRDPKFQKRAWLRAIIAPLGVVSKGAQTEVFHNTFAVSNAQDGTHEPLAFATRGAEQDR